MKVLSLFDGCACGMLAFQSAGIPVAEYHAYEIDKYAVKVSQHNFTEIIHHGDVFDGDFTKYNGFDWLIGGSPCTYWSIAQNPEKREKTASGIGWELFQQYVRALKEAEPEYFLYENNFSMSQAIKDGISESFGFEPIMINSALVSAQNRKRLYWVGKRNYDGTYRKCRIEQLEDKGLLVRDILDSGFIVNGTNNNSYAVTASYSPIVSDSIIKNRKSMVAEPLNVVEGRSRTIIDGKAVTLKACAGGAGAKTGLYAVKSNVKETLVYEVKNGKIKYKQGEYPITLPDGFYIIRKLSVSEYKRLQTIPEWYDFSVISDTQAYKCIGNGWTIEVIAHLLKSAMQNQTEESYVQLSMF